MFTLADLKKVAADLGFIVEAIAERTQVVVGTYLGYKNDTTKAGKPMFVLGFMTAEGVVETINMPASSDRPRLNPGDVYSARWLGQKFECVPGAEGFPTSDGDIVLDDDLDL